MEPVLMLTVKSILVVLLITTSQSFGLLFQSSSTISAVWRNPPYLAILTEPDGCDSAQRTEETIKAIQQATNDEDVDIVVVRLSDDDTGTSEQSTNKWKLVQSLSQSKQQLNQTYMLVINNDIEMALQALTRNISIDGIHLKERDAHSIPFIRNKFYEIASTHKNKNRSFMIGTSCHSLQSALQLYQNLSCAPDYLFVGTCYPSQSHPEKTLDQLEGPFLPGKIKKCLHQMIENKNNASISWSPVVFAIGGIDERNCHEPVINGADGVGVIRSVMRTKDPRTMVQQIKMKMRSALRTM